MEGICGNCNGNPDDDLIINSKSNMTLPPTNTELQNFALSWLAKEPKLSLNESEAICHVHKEPDCLPLPPETDPCFKILDEEAFAKCHLIVDPISYVTACQQDLCRTGPTQKGSCDSIAAYARECLRNGICIDWRRNGFCPMECVAPFVYHQCGCGDSCQSIEEKQKQIALSTAIKDAQTIEKMKSICKVGLSEGCFCPNGKILHGGKCLSEIECRVCDDKVSFENLKYFMPLINIIFRVIYLAMCGIRIFAQSVHAETIRKLNAKRFNVQHRRFVTLDTWQLNQHQMVHAVRNILASRK